MFKEILFTQWKWGKLYILVGALVALAIPLLALQSWIGYEPGGHALSTLLDDAERATGFLPGLAAALGLALGLSAWASDRRGHHVYALALPMPRGRYAMMRYAAGAIMLGAPVLAVWIASLVAVGAAPIPMGVQSYSTSLAFRFALAVLLAYSFFFALGTVERRIAWVVVLVVVLAVVFTGTFYGSGYGAINHLLRVFGELPSPLAVFLGRWRFIDV